METNVFETKKKLRKVVSTVSIVSVAIAGIIGLGLLFSIL